MVNTISPDMNLKRQLRILAIVFGVLISILIICYVAFLRFNYAVLYKDLTMSDASTIVAELEAKEIKYRLRNGGKDILVPAIEADSVRLGVLDANAPVKHLDGFNLFDDSEMGLTDFAQKIKYQRALQGELARTIMMIDGVENARVHIAIPERVLFRGETSRPSAAVTLVTRSGQFDEELRIAGIRNLVAAAISNLNVEDVTVLNSVGEIISEVESPVSAALSEYTQLASAYKDQIDIALAVDVPELKYDLKVLARPLRIGLLNGGEEKLKEAKRNYALRVNITTDEAISEEQQASINELIMTIVQLDVSEGDTLSFKQRNLPLNLSLETAKAVKNMQELDVEVRETPMQTSVDSISDYRVSSLIIGGALLLLVTGVGVLAIRRRRYSLSPTEHIEFAQRLRLQLQENES